MESSDSDVEITHIEYASSDTEDYDSEHDIILFHRPAPRAYELRPNRRYADVDPDPIIAVVKAAEFINQCHLKIDHIWGYDPRTNSVLIRWQTTRILHTLISPPIRRAINRLHPSRIHLDSTGSGIVIWRSTWVPTRSLSAADVEHFIDFLSGEARDEGEDDISFEDISIGDEVVRMPCCGHIFRRDTVEADFRIRCQRARHIDGDVEYLYNCPWCRNTF